MARKFRQQHLSSEFSNGQKPQSVFFLCNCSRHEFPQLNSRYAQKDYVIDCRARLPFCSAIKSSTAKKVHLKKKYVTMCIVDECARRAQG